MDFTTAQHAEAGGCTTYLNCLKSLNEAVLLWIEQHVKANSLVILSPIFDDYNRHLAELEQKYHQTKCAHPRYNGPSAKNVIVPPEKNSLALNSSPAAPKSSLPSASDLFKKPSNAPQPAVSSTGFAFSSNTSNGVPLFAFGATSKPADTAKAESSNAQGGQSKSADDVVMKVRVTEALANPVASAVATSSTAANSTTATTPFQFGTGQSSGPMFQFAFGSAQPAVTSSSASTASTPTPALFNFGSTPSSAGSTSTSNFVFGASASTGSSTAGTNPLFAFGTTAVSSSGAAQPAFMFGSSAAKPQVFGSIFGTSANGAASAASSGSQSLFGSSSTTLKATSESDKFAETAEEGDDAPDEPPKAEPVQHSEPGAVFTAENVKLYYLDEGKYVIRGTGSLFLKPVSDNGSRTQLIVRANNSLGTVLLSALLAESMRFEKLSDSKAIRFLCAANPPPAKVAAGKPVVFLVRAESPEQLDTLFTQLETCKASK